MVVRPIADRLYNYLLLQGSVDLFSASGPSTPSSVPSSYVPSKRKRPIICDCDDSDDEASDKTIDATVAFSDKNVDVNIRSVKRPKLNELIPDAVQRRNAEVVKEKDRSKIIPHPFPFPCNYRRDVELCLNTGRMTKEANKHFITAIASAMFCYKRLVALLSGFYLENFAWGGRFEH